MLKQLHLYKYRLPQPPRRQVLILTPMQGRETESQISELPQVTEVDADPQTWVFATQPGVRHSVLKALRITWRT